MYSYPFKHEDIKSSHHWIINAVILGFWVLFIFSIVVSPITICSKYNNGSLLRKN